MLRFRWPPGHHEFPLSSCLDLSNHELTSIHSHLIPLFNTYWFFLSSLDLRNMRFNASREVRDVLLSLSILTRPIVTTGTYLYEVMMARLDPCFPLVHGHSRHHHTTRPHPALDCELGAGAPRACVGPASSPFGFSALAVCPFVPYSISVTS